jgi:hypothetical protein
MKDEKWKRESKGPASLHSFFVFLSSISFSSNEKLARNGFCVTKRLILAWPTRPGPVWAKRTCSFGRITGAHQQARRPPPLSFFFSLYSFFLALYLACTRSAWQANIHHELAGHEPGAAKPAAQQPH